MDANNIIPITRFSDIQTIEKLSVLAKRYKPDSEFYPIGFPLFDDAMDGGVRAGELITVSGRTGEGKTTFCQQISVNLSDNNIPSLWFSYEMGFWYLNDKFKRISKNDLAIYSPIEIISSELKFLEEEIIEAREKACKVVFIDHLHYLVPLGGIENTSLLVGGIVRELKKIAVRNQIIIFLIAHAKKIYQGENLDLSSLRDNALVACESDYVYLIERIRQEKGKLDSQGFLYTNQTKIQLAKNRRKGDLKYLLCEYSDNRFKPSIDYGTYQSNAF